MAKTFSEKLSIGQMAKLNNISVQTLRYYEKMGLLSPKWVDAGASTVIMTLSSPVLWI